LPGGVLVNPGSEPERDDTGLPPVDVEIPDDARELDRDVQAYYREVRAHRRRSRSSRLRHSFARDGVVLPLLACCLIFALITGTLLTVFSASNSNQQGPGAAGTATGPAAGLVLHNGQPLPEAVITVENAHQRLQQLPPALLLLVPAGCNCAATLADVAYELNDLNASGVPILLVRTSSAVPLGELSAALHEGANLATTYPADALTDAYPVAGLTAVIVAPGQTVEYAQQLRPDNLQDLLQAVLK
jgi:hypothetical protein